MNKKRYYLTKEDLSKEIILSKKKYRESNVPLTPSECFTPKLTEFLNLIVERYANKGNWRNYTWLEDMKSAAKLTLCQNAFKYDETKFDNPFGYYTQCIKYCFITEKEKEQNVRDIKDNLWESIGMTPSHSRQLQNQILDTAREAYFDKIKKSKDSDGDEKIENYTKDIKIHKKEVMELTERIDNLSILTTKVSKLTTPDSIVDQEIATLLKIDVKKFTSNIDDIISILGTTDYKIENNIEIAGELVNCISVYHKETKSHIKKIINTTDPSRINLILLSIALVINRDLLVKELRNISGYNLSAARIPISQNSNETTIDIETSEGDINEDNKPRRKPKDKKITL